MSTVTPAGPQADLHLTGVFAPVVDEVDVPDVRVAATPPFAREETTVSSGQAQPLPHGPQDRPDDGLADPLRTSSLSSCREDTPVLA
jgi:hypothetical protein